VVALLVSEPLPAQEEKKKEMERDWREGDSGLYLVELGLVGDSFGSIGKLESVV
jgi:hypothetical protein